MTKLFFAFEISYMTYAVRRSVLDMPVPGSFRNVGHEISGQEGSDHVKQYGSNQVKVEEGQSKIRSHSPTVH